MATENPLHPTIDSETRSNQGRYEDGPKNVRATYGPKNTTQPRIYIPGVSTSYKEKKATTPNDSFIPNPSEVANGTTLARQPRTVKRGLRRKAEGTLRLLAIRARLTPVIASMSFFAFFFYIGQLACGMIALMGLVIAVLFDDAASAGGDILAALAMQFFNLDFSISLGIYLLGCFLVFTLYFIQIAIGTLLFKAALVHPWFGQGAGLKCGSIIFILLSSFIPLLNLLPLFWLWIFAVAAYPK